MAIVGAAVVAASVVGAVLLPGNPPAESTETAPVAVDGAPLPAFPEPGTDDPAVEQPAPTATGSTFSGGDATLLEDGHATIMTFLAHWCPHCQREVPVLVDHLGGNLPDRVRLVGVPTATDRTRGNYPPSVWLEAEKWPFDVLVDSADGEVAAAYGVRSFPAFVVVGADGRVVARTSGELSTQQLDALVELAAGSL